MAKNTNLISKKRGRPPKTETTGGVSPREHLLACAMDLIHERGYQSMSLAELADRSGMQKGHLTHYFPNKQALLAAVIAERSRQLLQGLDHQLDDEPDTLARARLALNRLLEYVASQEQKLLLWGCPLGGLALECSRLAAQEPATAIGREPLIQLQTWLVERLQPALGYTGACKRAEEVLVRLQGAALMSQALHDPSPLRRQLTALKDEPMLQR